MRTRRCCCSAGGGTRFTASAFAARLRAGLPAFFYAQGAWESLASLAKAVVNVRRRLPHQAYVGKTLTELLMPPGFEQPSELSGAPKPCCAERQSCAARSATGGALPFGLRSAHLTEAPALATVDAGITFQSGELDGFDINFVELVRCPSCSAATAARLRTSSAGRAGATSCPHVLVQPAPCLSTRACPSLLRQVLKENLGLDVTYVPSCLTPIWLRSTSACATAIATLLPAQWSLIRSALRALRLALTPLLRCCRCFRRTTT